MNSRGMACAAVLALGMLLSACGGGGSGPAAGLPVQNVAPVVNAGNTQNVNIGTTVVLDGSGSSDADGDTLTYQWELTVKPAGSAAVLSSTTTQKPTFVADVAGSYTATLVVNDGKVNSANAASVSITTWPVTGYTKLDANGLPLADSATNWSCVRDNASKLIWEVKNTTDSADLRYYKHGYTNYDTTNYTQSQIDASSNSVGFKKAVNAQGLCGATDWRLPTLDELKSLLSGSLAPYINTSYFPDVDLSGTCGNACYGWFWSSSPYLSAYPDYARLVYFNFYNATGYYATRSFPIAVRLVRSDLRVQNVAPVANAGSTQSVIIGNTVVLDGSASSDADGDSVNYQWVLTSKPAGSAAVLSSATAQKPTFVADVAGSYTATLVVNDAEVNSAETASVSITATPLYTKLDANGQPLADSATSWSCVRDNASKLIWEVKNTTNPADLRYYKNGYTNYDSLTKYEFWTGSTWVIPTQSQIDAPSNSIGFQKAVNAQGLCGATDWRLPTLEELKSLLSGSSAPYINTSYFPDVDTQACASCSGWYFWSSWPWLGYDNMAGNLTFSGPFRNYTGSNRYLDLMVRLVR